MTKELAPYQPAGPLADMGTEINDAHALAMVHAGEAMNNALRCGDLLTKAKATAKHGQWLPWLRQNIAFSERTAQSYMRLAGKFGPDKRNAVADLSVRRVLQEIATPRRTALEEDLAAWLERSEPIPAFVMPRRPSSTAGTFSSRCCFWFSPLNGGGTRSARNGYGPLLF